MKANLTAVVLAMILGGQGAWASPEYPPSRNAVGTGEFYVLDEFGSWTVGCWRDDDDGDVCEAATTLTAFDQGLELDLAVVPYSDARRKKVADVDVVPVAFVDISPYSLSPHYNGYSAAITQIDGQPFDGFWCQLNGDCSRGPELEPDSGERLLEAQTVTVAIYDVTPEKFEEMTKISKNFALNPVTEFEVPMSGFREAYDRALTFTASVHGMDVETAEPQINACGFNLQGKRKSVTYHYDDMYEAEHTSFREIFRGARGEGDCPSYVMLASLTPDMTGAQRELFCLDYDKKSKTYLGFQLGQANAYGICKAPSKSFCTRVNDTKAAALAITGLATASVGGTVGATTATGVSVVAHSSGAAILTGPAGYIAGTLGTIGTSIIAVLTAPATAAAAAVSVVAVGGAVFVCS